MQFFQFSYLIGHLITYQLQLINRCRARQVVPLIKIPWVAGRYPKKRQMQVKDNNVYRACFVHIPCFRKALIIATILFCQYITHIFIYKNLPTVDLSMQRVVALFAVRCLFSQHILKFSRQKCSALEQYNCVCANRVSATGATKLRGYVSRHPWLRSYGASYVSPDSPSVVNPRKSNVTTRVFA